MENALDVNKLFNAIAQIIGDREGVEITVKEIRKIDSEQKGASMEITYIRQKRRIKNNTDDAFSIVGMSHNFFTLNTLQVNV